MTEIINDDIPNITMAQLPSILETTIGLGMVPLILGPSGIGKSQGIKQWADERAAALGSTVWQYGDAPITDPDSTYGFLDFRVALVDVLDTKGAPKLEGEVTRFLPPSLLPNVERHGKNGVLFLDELPQGFPSVTNALSQLVLGGHIGDGYKLPDGWVIISAGNEKRDGAQTNNIGAQMLDRHTAFRVSPDVPSFIKYLNNMGSDGRVGAFLRLRGNDLLHAYKKGLTNFPTPRGWVKVDKALSIPDAILRETIVSGIVGVGPARELEGFLSMMTELTNWSSICADPHNARMPDRTDALFAMIGMASNRVSAEHAPAACAYIARMPQEFQALFALDVIENKAKVDVVNTRDFSTLRLGLGDLVV